MFAARRSRFGAYALRVIAVLGVICMTLWTGAVGCLWVNETRLVFGANRSRIVRPFDYRNLIELKTADGIDLDAVVLPAAPISRYWILFCPPSAGTIHGRLQGQLLTLQSLGYNVFAFDYRGFGRNRGSPSESGLYDDAVTAYHYLTEKEGVPPDRIILAGRSLGSAVAVELGTRVPSAGLLLMSALDSVPSTASRLYPWAPVSLLASQRFDSVAKASRVDVPVLLVHAVNDRLIPVEAARALLQRFPGPKLMLETSGGHNRAGFSDPASLGTALARFWPIQTGRSESE
jgi:uncharacterized protein